jgi:cytoskeletal protein RodZ
MQKIGAKIQQARLDKGIQLEEIAHHTHIHLAHLQKIEAGQFDFLPRPYVTAFIKTFAQYVGLNGDTLIQHWREQEAAEKEALRLQQQQTPKAARQKESARPMPTPVMQLKPKSLATPEAAAIPLAIPYLKEIGIALGIILVMAVLVFLMSGGSDGGPEQTQQPAGNGTQTTKVEDPKQLAERAFEEVSRQAQQTTELKPAPPTSPATNLTLQAQFAHQTRMRVVTDRRDTTHTTYKAGETKTFQAKEKFNLQISTGGRVTLLLAGKNLGTFGQPGKVARLTITSAGVTEQYAFTPQPPQPRNALPLDTLSIRRPRGFN